MMRVLLGSAFRVLAVPLLLLLGAGWAQAQPLLRYSWDQCDPVIQNKQFTTAMNYLQVISATNVSQNHRGHGIVINIGPAPLPDAWRFDAQGCQAGQFTPSSASIGGFSKTCPSMAGANAVTSATFQLDGTTSLGDLRLFAAWDAAVPNPATRYTVWQVTFNHAFSAVGPQDPAQFCGNADVAQCFGIIAARFVLEDFSEIDWAVETGFVTWNNAGNDFGGTPCPAVPTRPTTWGRLKGLYR